MAPEQFDGRADERSDIYSVGCLLYECLTGAAPFEGTMAAQVMAHRSKPRPDPRELAPQVPPALAAVVTRAMATDPAARFQSVHEMLAALAAVGPVDDPPEARDVRSRGAVPPAEVPAHSGALVTRWSKLKTYEVGFALSAFIVALLPGLVWVSDAFVPNEHRPQAMSDANATAWWFLAVVIAGAVLLVRRRSFLAAIGGPAVGEPRPQRIVDESMRRGLWLAAGAAARGSLPMLFPWYVLVVSGLAGAVGVQWPDDVFGSSWGVAWVLMPAAAVALVLRGVSRLRLRFGSLMLAMIHLAAAVLAVILFVAYPHAI